MELIFHPCADGLRARFYEYYRNDPQNFLQLMHSFVHMQVVCVNYICLLGNQFLLLRVHGLKSEDMISQDGKIGLKIFD